MSKTFTKEQAQCKKLRRLQGKTLEHVLHHRFLHHYGYDKGPITARAIVKDIVRLIDEYFLVTPLPNERLFLHNGQLTDGGARRRAAAQVSVDRRDDSQAGYPVLLHR